MTDLIDEIKKCMVCAQQLDHDPRPILSVGPKSKIIIIGQAPGAIVHKTGIPWNDKSGENLRSWMGITNETFYDAKQIGIVPMGFCYPGKGKSGDLPPRKECAPLWHNLLLSHLTDVKLIMLIGSYAQKYYLNERTAKTLTQTVQNFEAYLPKYFVLPHPSPRNNIWLAKNPWFKNDVLPILKNEVRRILNE